MWLFRLRTERFVNCKEKVHKNKQYDKINKRSEYESLTLSPPGLTMCSNVLNDGAR